MTLREEKMMRITIMREREREKRKTRQVISSPLSSIFLSSFGHTAAETRLPDCAFINEPLAMRQLIHFVQGNWRSENQEEGERRKERRERWRERERESKKTRE